MRRVTPGMQRFICLLYTNTAAVSTAILTFRPKKRKTRMITRDNDYRITAMYYV